MDGSQTAGLSARDLPGAVTRWPQSYSVPRAACVRRLRSARHARARGENKSEPPYGGAVGHARGTCAGLLACAVGLKYAVRRAEKAESAEPCGPDAFLSSQRRMAAMTTLKGITATVRRIVRDARYVYGWARFLSGAK